MLYIRMFLVTGVALYTSRVVISQLGVTDYGIFHVVGGVVTLLSFLNGAMANVTQRFLSYEIGANNKARLIKTFRTSIAIHIIIGITVLLIAETIGLWFLNRVMTIPSSQLSGANWVYQCAIAGFLLSIFNVPFNAAIIAREKMRIYAYLGLLEVCMKLAVAFSLTLLVGDKLKFYALLVLGINTVVGLASIVYCKHRFNECKRLKPLFEKEIFRPMIGFASWSTLGSFAWIGKSQGCNIILNLFFGPAINAAYGISNQVNAAIGRFVQTFTTAVNPQIVKSYSSGNFNNLQQLIIWGAKFSFLLLLAISFPLLMATGDLLKLWLVNIPDNTVIFTQLIILNSLLESFSYTMSTGLRAVGKVKWNEIGVGCTLLMNLPASYILLKLGYAPASIIIVTIALTVTSLAVRLGLLRKYVPEFSAGRFCKAVFLPTSGISIICTALFCLSRHFDMCSQLNPIATITLAFIIVVALEYTLGLNDGERQLVCNFIRSKLNRKKDFSELPLQ